MSNTQYVFKIYNLINFNICLHFSNHHYNQDNSELLSFIKTS